MQWTAPPTRRELTLVFFSLTIFIFAYNLESSLSLLGLGGLSSKVSLTSRVWLQNGGGALDRDGRRPAPWRDDLEDKIFGEWKWDPNQVSGDGHERAQDIGSDRYGAAWTGQKFTVADWEVFGSVHADQNVVEIGETIAQTTVRDAVPGCTILENAFMINGSLVLITDDESTLPRPIISASRPEVLIWSTERAQELLGRHLAMIYGTTFVATDNSPSLLSLTALYHALTRLSSSKAPIAPTLLFQPNVLIPTPGTTSTFRKLVRSMFPTLGLAYSEDWDDYATIGLPFRFERVVLGDQTVSGSRSFQSAGEAKAWWAPVRNSLLSSLGIPDADAAARRRTQLTYISSSSDSAAELNASAHAELVEALRRLNADVRVVDLDSMSWQDAMRIVATSNIIVGLETAPFAPLLAPGSQSSVVSLSTVEAAPQAALSVALGTRFYVWYGGSMHDASHGNIPTTSVGIGEVQIDVPSVISTIRQMI